VAKDNFDRALASHANLTPTHRQEYQTAAHALFDRLTHEGLERFNRHVSGYRFFPDLDQLSAYSVPGYSQLPAALRPYAQVTGAYNRQTGELELDGGSRVAGITFPIQDRYAHEFGHAIDGPSFESSGQQEWLDAWQSEIRPNPPNPNAATNAHEGFAAFCAMACGTAANRAVLEHSHPLCVAFWRGQGLW
jgi:hypothetical protein